MVVHGSVYCGGCHMGVAQMNWSRTDCTVEVQYMTSLVGQVECRLIATGVIYC